LLAEKEKATATTLASASNVPDLYALQQGLQDEIAGGFSSFFGMTTSTTDGIVGNGAAVLTDSNTLTIEASKDLLQTRELELNTSLQKEKKLKVLLRNKMKEIEEKDKEIKQFRENLVEDKSDNVNGLNSENDKSNLDSEKEELVASKITIVKLENKLKVLNMLNDILIY
jgi:hypothetical protein